jgi:hypothetical protein
MYDRINLWPIKTHKFVTRLCRGVLLGVYRQTGSVIVWETAVWVESSIANLEARLGQVLELVIENGRTG